MTYVDKICSECHLIFTVSLANKKQITCSVACSNSRRRTGVYVDCPVCGALSYRHPSQITRGYKYCSKKCWYSVMKPTEKSIQALHDNRMKRDYSDPKARQKLSVAMKKAIAEGRLKLRHGSDNNLWKGGIATLQNTLRQSPEYKAWRKAVYERDNYACQHCGTNKDLHAHHIKTFSQYPDLRYDIDNGLTVCRLCHGNIHGRYLPDISNANRRTTTK